MSVRAVRLPDVGEGIAEAELVAWHVAVGDAVTSDTVVAEVLTDKATVEIYAPCTGTIAALHGEPGDVLAVGADFFGVDTGDGEPPPATSEPAHPEPTQPVVALPEPAPVQPEPAQPAPPPVEPALVTGRRVTAAPAVRARARALGIDLGSVRPAHGEHVTHQDLDALLGAPTGAGGSRAAGDVTTPIIGLRRKIAERMTASLRVPHITYVDEVDVTRLEQLRESLATEHPDQPRLTPLPFVMLAVVRAVVDQPHLNATLDDRVEPAVLTAHGAVHLGIATQTGSGLIVPVVRDAQALDLWQAARELARLSSAAREGTATAAELSGSTITITSLGALGGIVTTPIINHPEVAIVGVNKMQTRPVWDGSAFVPRQVMNISASFDHRVVDGYDAAVFVQRIRALLEEPALLFVPPAPSAGG